MQDLYFNYGFWCWKHKLNGVLKMLSLLSNFSFTNDKATEVLEGIRGSNDEKGLWFSFDMSCDAELKLRLAYDDADSDIVQISLSCNPSFQEQIILIDQIQSSLNIIAIAD